MKQNLLIIYQNSTKYINTNKLESLFDIILIPKIQRVDFKDFKLKGNHLATRYNDILFTTDSKYVFFICSAEFNDNVLNTLLNFNGLDKDFDFSICKKTNNLIISLSGLVVKKEALIRIGCFDKHTFNNLFLNFLINYSRFGGMVYEDVFHQLKIGSLDFWKYSYWKYFEESFYNSQPLYKKDYLELNSKIETILVNNLFKKMIVSFMKWRMNRASSKIEKIVQTNTCLGYW